MQKSSRVGRSETPYTCRREPLQLWATLALIRAEVLGKACRCMTFHLQDFIQTRTDPKLLYHSTYHQQIWKRFLQLLKSEYRYLNERKESEIRRTRKQSNFAEEKRVNYKVDFKVMWHKRKSIEVGRKIKRIVHLLYPIHCIKSYYIHSHNDASKQLTLLRFYHYYFKNKIYLVGLSNLPKIR